MSYAKNFTRSAKLYGMQTFVSIHLYKPIVVMTVIAYNKEPAKDHCCSVSVSFPSHPYNFVALNISSWNDERISSAEMVQFT